MATEYRDTGELEGREGLVTVDSTVKLAPPLTVCDVVVMRW